MTTTDERDESQPNPMQTIRGVSSAEADANIQRFQQSLKSHWPVGTPEPPWATPKTHNDVRALADLAAHHARLGWAVEKHASRGEVEVRIDDLRNTARELEETT